MDYQGRMDHLTNVMEKPYGKMKSGGIAVGFGDHAGFILEHRVTGMGNQIWTF